ncbi:threo-3-hydroxy-L-aspartate ammonia-lyase [Williamsia sp. CHRR-6]|uniref:threo-3-hydroxy-L-aspartate ammonia-lyase n=1 Tax=Williamsia sp. CHRR-6 TaxID=2835871 RepID=UPI001BD9A41B|nr:threo-3-hydroxy-L-aspartate ammonia-lyase [Williamsia sp. CHRR-6]MBT0566379.1 threo-3-hydroxy-L-aspartate ammonia-lyase [Williamsia sp. CHRR-6]
MPITIDDVTAAADILDGVAHRTPVITSRLLDEAAGAQLFCKCENLQRMGAFKFRGAYTAISRLGPQRARGVVAFSSGNHAQAVALAASLFDIPATIVMPHDAPAAKVAATRGYGAQIVGYDRYTQDRQQVAAALAHRTGAAVLPPFDHPDVIAGQGTATLELLSDTDDLDAILIPLGGGGLLAGGLVAAAARAPGVAVYGVEPAAGDDGRRSLRAGRIVTIAPPRTIADGAQTTALGTHTFEIIAEYVTDILTATDEQLLAAMGLVATRTKMVVEPTGALGVAAALNNRDLFAGRRVGVIISGGNVDLDRFAAAAPLSADA